MSLIAVVIRKLPDNRPVTSTIIKESTDNDFDDMKLYFKHQANEYVQQFVSQFPEFKQAEWYLDIIDLATGKTVTTDQLSIYKLT